jgi:hypothetical protein
MVVAKFFILAILAHLIAPFPFLRESIGPSTQALGASQKLPALKAFVT